MNRHLFDTMLSGRERYAESVFEHTMLGINRILNVSSAIPEESGPQQPMPGIPALVERPAPSSPATPTAGTAGVGVFSEREQLRMQPAYERFIALLHDLLSNDRFDEAHDFVRAEHRAINGRQ